MCTVHDASLHALNGFFVMLMMAQSSRNRFLMLEGVGGEEGMVEEVASGLRGKASTLCTVYVDNWAWVCCL